MTLEELITESIYDNDAAQKQLFAVVRGTRNTLLPFREL
jgi:hypothetical protein